MVQVTFRGHTFESRGEARSEEQAQQFRGNQLEHREARRSFKPELNISTNSNRYEYCNAPLIYE